MSVYINNFNSIPRGDLAAFEYYFGLGESNIDTMLQSIDDGNTVWTVDKHSGVTTGDINLFMCAVSSSANINGIRSYVEGEYGRAENKFYEEQCRKYKRYSGTLMAIGFVEDMPYTNERMAMVPFDNIIGFDNPIPYSAFRDFISVSKTGSMTNVGYPEYRQLLSVIKIYNPNIDLSRFERPPINTKRVAASNTTSSIKPHKKASETPAGLSDEESRKLFPIGCKVIHKAFGEGVVKANVESRVLVAFADGIEKELSVDFCVKNNIMTKQ